MDKKAQLTIIGAAIILLSVVTITYGFFVSGVDNTNPQTATITTGTMELTFADNDKGVTKQMIFGESIEKKFTLENTGTVDATAYLYWKDLVNTYLYGSLVYKLEYSETSNGAKTVIMNNAYVPRSSSPTEEILSQILTVPADTTYYYTLTITLVNSETVDQTADLSATITTGFNIKVEGSSESAETLAALGLTNQVQEEPTDYNMFDYTYNGYYGINVWNSVDELCCDFTSMQKEGVNTQGIYAMEDDFGISYYFRGPKTLTNVVKFGKYDSDMYYYYQKNADGNDVYTTGSLADCQRESDDSTYYCKDSYKYASEGNDMYWRIVRINGDGSLRLMYIGTGAEATGKNIYAGLSYFNYNYDNPKYAGYTYDNSNPNVQDGTPSDIKNYLEIWYAKNMLDEDANIANGQFFSDTTLYQNNEAIGSLYGGILGYSYPVWSATLRLGKSAGASVHNLPKLYTTVTDKTYGGIYYLKVGLINADELVLSGMDGLAVPGGYGYNNADYSYTSSGRYWTMTPAIFDNYEESGDVFTADAAAIDYPDVDFTNRVVPVINLGVETAQSLIGTGSTGDPYQLAEQK